MRGGVGVTPVQPRLSTNWGGAVITTTTNPQRIAIVNKDRQAWRVFNLGGATGRIGYSSDPNSAYIPLPADSSYPVGSDYVCENNELWYHGPTGAVLGVGET